MTPGDKQVVFNLRSKHGEAVAHVTDFQLAKAWRAFSQSDDYPDAALFVEHWLDFDYD